jgi:hypothetical protein
LAGANQRILAQDASWALLCLSIRQKEAPVGAGAISVNAIYGETLMADNTLSLVFVQGDEPVTTTEKIADGINVQHKNVIGAVRKYLSDFEEFGRVAFETRTIQTKGGPQERGYAVLNERQATLLLTYSKNTDIVRDFKKRLVKEFYLAVSSKSKPPATKEHFREADYMLPAYVGEATIDTMMRVADKYKVPRSFAMQMSAVEATRQTGMPWDKFLTQSEIMSNVPDEDVMLEPTDLGKHFNMSGAAMNKWLAAQGLQAMTKKGWEPTDIGRNLCERHAWSARGKSGYNYKWNLESIREMYILS